jgi:hypothetical protein
VNAAKAVIAGIVVAALPMPGVAVENAVGRTFPGFWVHPTVGVIPKEPGLRFTILPLGYQGSIVSGTRQAPQLTADAGQLQTNLSTGVSENFIITQYFYKVGHPKIGLGSSFYLPLAYHTTTATMFSQSRTFANAGLTDVFFSPLTLGIHFSENNNLAIDTKIWAPTGSFEVGRLANLGMNVWTFTPHVAHTYLWKKRGLEVDNYVAFDIYRENTATKYKSGTVFHWDGLLFQYLSPRGGFGVIVSNETQITPDTGPLADRLNGFQGRAWGAGPFVAYVAKVRDPKMIVQFRWIPEFHVSNLLRGETFMIGLTLMRGKQ